MKMRDDPQFEHLRVKCLICNDQKTYAYLGSHVSHKHKISAKSYKEKFGLPHNLSLMDDVTLHKKQKAFNQRREYYLKNLSTKNSFKKGHLLRTTAYWSALELKGLPLKFKDTSGLCHICGTKYDHLYSHLFNKHKLLKIE